MQLRRAASLVVLAGAILCGGCGPTEAERKAEEARRAALTPEERAAEDAAKAREEKFSRMQPDMARMAEKYVRQFLQYPHDAEFPWSLPSMTANEELTVFWLQSTVQAKNTFGATLTLPWKTCLVLRDDAWHLEYCEINEEVVYQSEDATATLGKLADAGNGADQVEIPTAEEIARRVPHRREAEMRTWTDSTGKHQTEAEFVSMSMGKVKLKKVDGTIIQLDMEKLSEDDRGWIHNRGKAGAVFGTPDKTKPMLGQELGEE